MRLRHDYQTRPLTQAGASRSAAEWASTEAAASRPNMKASA
jgi:hypothetical protein